MTFREFFSKYNLTDEQIKKYSTDLLGVAILKCIESSENLLSSEEQSSVTELLNSGEISTVMRMVQSKYSTDQWNVLLKKEMEVVVDSYMKTVLKRP